MSGRNSLTRRQGLTWHGPDGVSLSEVLPAGPASRSSHPLRESALRVLREFADVPRPQTVAPTGAAVHTRFFSSSPPALLVPMLVMALRSYRFRVEAPSSDSDPSSAAELTRLRVGGVDHRRQPFRGWLEVEEFPCRGGDGSYVLLRRDQVGGSPRVSRSSRLSLTKAGREIPCLGG